MNDFRAFEDTTMLALYRAWQDGRALISLGKALQEIGVSWEKGWLVRVHDSLRSKGFLEGPTNRRIEEMTIGSLTSQGLQYVEDNLSSHTADNIAAEPVAAIESSAWTGLPADFVLTEEKRSALVRHLDCAEEALPMSGASQHDQSQARAYIVAARALLEAPDPEPGLAWELLNRANQVAGIASLFVAIIALFVVS